MRSMQHKRGDPKQQAIAQGDSFHAERITPTIRSPHTPTRPIQSFTDLVNINITQLTTKHT